MNWHHLKMTLKLYFITSKTAMIESSAKPEDPIYLKEQTCLSFHLAQSPKVQWAKEITFSTETESPSNLPAILIDTLKEKTICYVLQWREENSKVQLYFSENEQIFKWKLIQMNHYPQAVAITDEKIFIFGRTQLYIVPIVTEEQPQCISLEAAQLIDVKLAFNEQYEPGVYAVFFSSRSGYFSKHFSRSSHHQSLWQKVKSICKNPFSSFPTFQYFKIIFPKILAVGILQNQLFLYDLHTMKISSLSLPLGECESSQKVIIKWRLNPPFELNTDGVQIYVARANQIEVFHATLVRKYFSVQINTQTIKQRVPLDQLLGGDILNWPNSSLFKRQEIIFAEGPIEDIQLFNNNLIYRCLKDNQKHIPINSIIFLSSKNRTNGIINQEMQLWKEYFTEGITDNFQDIQQNKLEKLGKRKIQSQELIRLTSWRKNNAYLNFMIFNERLYIVRRGSLSIFKEIDELQYALELYTEVMMSQDEAKIEMPQVSIKDQRLSQIEQALDLVLYEIKTSYYHKIMNQIKKCIQYEFLLEDQTDTFNGQIESKATLTASSLKDTINHVGKYLQFGIQNLKIEEKSLKNLLIIKILSYFRETYQDKTLTEEFSNSLLHKFVEHQFFIMKNDHFSLNVVLNRLFLNVLPDSFFNSNKTLSENDFLNFIISSMIENSQNEKLLLALQTQVKKYIQIFRISLEEGLFAQLLIKNNSLFQCYLLSHPPEDELKIILKYILGKGLSNLISNLKKIKSFIPDQLECLFSVKSKLENPHILQKMEDAFSKQYFLDQQQKQTKQLITQELLLFDSEESFQKNFQEISSLFDSLSFQSFDHFIKVAFNISQAENKQLTLNIINQNYQQAVELEGLMLTKYAAVFNRALEANIKKAIQDLWYINEILKRIQVSLGHYQRYCRLLFKMGPQIKQIHKKNKEQSIFRLVSLKVEQEERLLTQNFPPIYLSHFICSKVVISLWKLLCSNKQFFSKIIEQKFFQPSQKAKFVSYVIEVLVCKPMLTSNDLQILYFLLIKNGSDLVKNAIKECDPEKMAAFVNYLKRRRGHSVIIELTDEDVEQSDLPSVHYVDPFMQ